MEYLTVSCLDCKRAFKCFMGLGKHKCLGSPELWWAYEYLRKKKVKLRHDPNYRGIEIRISPEQLLEKVKSAGISIDQIGHRHGSGGYVLGRYNHADHYSPDNCDWCTVGENSVEVNRRVGQRRKYY